MYVVIMGGGKVGEYLASVLLSSALRRRTSSSLNTSSRSSVGGSPISFSIRRISPSFMLNTAVRTCLDFEV